MRITRHGGDGASFESADGKFVYYAKSIGASAGRPRLWRIPVTGGEEVKILDSLFRLQFAVAASGIYFAAPTDYGSSHASSIRFLSFRTGKVTTIAPSGMGRVNPDSLCPLTADFCCTRSLKLIGSDLMLVENFR